MPGCDLINFKQYSFRRHNNWNFYEKNTKRIREESMANNELDISEYEVILDNIEDVVQRQDIVYKTADDVIETNRKTQSSTDTGKVGDLEEISNIWDDYDLIDTPPYQNDGKEYISINENNEDVDISKDSDANDDDKKTLDEVISDENVDGTENADFIKQYEISLNGTLSTLSLSTDCSSLNSDVENDILNTLLLEYDIIRHYFSENQTGTLTFIDMREYYFVPEAYAPLNCKRRDDSKFNKYRVGPLFRNGKELKNFENKKPARLKLSEEFLMSKSCETGLLVYFESLAANLEAEEIDLNFLESIISSEINLDVHDQYGQTVLHACVRDWNKDIVLFLLKNNADPNVKDKYGFTPLHIAASLDCVEVATVLLTYEANPNIQTDYTKETPVHFAAKYNSINVLKQLIKFGGLVESVDYLSRSPLMAASAHGCSEVVRFLLHEADVPAATTDSLGNSALHYLIERLPRLAYETLNQYISTNMPYTEYYLMPLETTSSNRKSGIKSPLEMISFYKNRQLIMHPVLQKSIDMKWSILGAQKWLLFRFVIAIFYMSLWLVLAYTLDDRNNFYFYFHTKTNYEMIWEIFFEALIIVLALYFFLKELVYRRKTNLRHREWTDCRKRILLTQRMFSHPAWPKESEFPDSEENFLKSISKSRNVISSRFLYECVVLFFLLLTIITRVATIFYNNSNKIFLLHKTIFGITMITSSIRIIIISSYFRQVTIFLKMIPLVVKPFFQIIFLFLQLYIPFVALFWLMFSTDFLGKWGTIQNETSVMYIQTIDHIHFKSLDKLFSFLFALLFEYSLFETSNKPLLYAFVSLYYIIVIIVVCHVLVANITATIIIEYDNFKADASLLQAEFLNDLEKDLNGKNMRLVDFHYQSVCNPLVVRNEELTTLVKQSATREGLAILQKKIEKVKDILTGMDERFTMRNKELVYMIPSVVHNCRIYQRQQKITHRILRQKFRTFMIRGKVCHESIDNILKVDGIKAKSLLGINDDH